MPNTEPQPIAPWHALASEAVLDRLMSNAVHGLDASAATMRTARYGRNEIKGGRRQSRFVMLLSQFSDSMILLLIGASVLSGFVGDVKDTVVILAIVGLNAIAGFVQEIRAANAIAALRLLSAPVATVLRGGHLHNLPAVELVPGDIVLLEAGQAVPADLRLIEAAGLCVSEAALTGESVPVDKQIAPEDESQPLPERHAMAYKGTTVLHGHGRGVVVATGMATELGRIAAMLKAMDSARTPLQRRLAQFGRQITIAALMICVLIFSIGLLRGEAPLQMLLTAVSLAVAAIPEALPAVITVLLALGASRMAKEKALIRRLPAVETLGSVTAICSDKTGTLTLNDMRLTHVWLQGQHRVIGGLVPRDPDVAALLRAAVLCSDLTWDENGKVLGDPTETALWHAERELVPDQKTTWPLRLMEIPFDSTRKRMTALYQEGNVLVSYMKGAPETVVPLCATMTATTGIIPIQSERVMHAATAMAENGLRVLAIACGTLKEKPEIPEVLEHELEFLGLIGLLDPLRPEVVPAVATCRAAGIRPIMITGDHPMTARAIARAVGILDGDGLVMTGSELSALDDETLRHQVMETSVYARVDPAQKIRIITALRANGQIVAMTGDGVNDAPALAQADIGVAMGQGGTDVAREAASLVLLDDNFATIVVAIREGRRIYDNIRKFIRFIIACNSAEIWTIFLAPFFGLPIPLLPIQILWINLVTDGLPGLTLAAEPAEQGIMTRPPRSPHQGVFGGGMAMEILWSGLMMAAITLVIEAGAITARNGHWQGMAFTVLTFVQMWQILAIRSEHGSLFQQGLMSNKPLFGAVMLTCILQLAVIYIPALNAIFHTRPLSFIELTVCIVASSSIFFALELAKWLRRKAAG